MAGWSLESVPVAAIALLAIVPPAATAAERHPAALTVLRVPPSATAGDTSAPNHRHVVVYDRRRRSNGRLLVFLPGTDAKPSCCELFLRETARLGYRAIGLTYPNGESVTARCRDDLGCYGRVRQNVFDGRSASAASSLPASNAVQHRLTALIRYLARRHPREGWSRFLRHGRPDYRRIVFAGHSQGGGEAAYIARVRRLAGVVMLSAPVDAVAGAPPVPAYWLKAAHRTPVARYAGLVHTADPFAGRVAVAWAALGLDRFGAPSSVDGVPAPFGGSHELLTSLPVDGGFAAHASTAADGFTPRCANGTPALAVVWRYLLQIAAGRRATAATGCTSLAAAGHEPGARVELERSLGPAETPEAGVAERGLPAG
jgi:hypothetical protein